MSTQSNNYAPPRSVVADMPSGTVAYEKASRGSRMSASMIDGLIFAAPVIPSYVAAARAIAHAGRLTASSLAAALAATGVFFVVALLIELVLFVIMAVLVYRNAQTIGKKLLGIKVARTDGSRASLARIFWLRNVVNGLFGIVPVIGAIYPLVDILCIFGDARRCCHDYLADTVVIRA